MNSPAQRTLEAQADNVLHMDPDKEMAEVENLGLDWADKDAQCRFLDESKKSLHAQLATEYTQNSTEGGKKPMSAAQAEVRAYADDRYTLHLEAMRDARREANRAKVLYDKACVRVDLLRSLVAARREEMRLGGIRR